MKFRTLDGKTLEAAGLQQLAEVLWESKFDPEPTIEDWMRGSAQRAAIYNGAVISTESPEAHVRDLIKAGYLMPVNE